MEEVREYIDEIVFYIRDQFVDGRISTAKNLVMDCVIVTQNRHCIALLDKVSYGERLLCWGEREGGREGAREGGREREGEREEMRGERGVV